MTAQGAFWLGVIVGMAFMAIVCGILVEVLF